MSNIYVYQVDLPHGIREMVTPGTDDDFTVYINSRLSDTAKIHALAHAVDHCKNDDFSKDDVQQIELDAHGRDLL